MCEIQSQPSSLCSAELPHIFMDTDYGTHVIVRSKASACSSPTLNCMTIVASPKLLQKAGKTTQGSPIHLGRLKASCSSLTSLQQKPETPSSEASRPTRVFIGSINIESPAAGKCSPLSKGCTSLERFSDDFYSRIAVFMDQEGLEIIEAENCARGFKQIIKLQVVENSEEETEGNSVSLLKCIRIDSGKSDMSMDVKSSKLFQRRSSVTQTPTPKLLLPTISSDDNFVSSVSMNHIKQLHQIVGFQAKERTTDFKNKLKTLLSVDSCDQRSEALESPVEISECYSPASIFEFAQNFEKMSPDLPSAKRNNFKFEKQGSLSPSKLNKGSLICFSPCKVFKRGNSFNPYV